MNPLTKEDENQILKFFSEKGAIYSLVSDRVGFIIEAIAHSFDSKIEWWSFWESSEYDSMGSLEKSYDSKMFCFDGQFKRSYSWTIIDKHGDELDLNNEFPTRWLYENFESELRDGKVKFDQKEAARKAKLQEKKALKSSEKKKLIQSAKSKLSLEEIKALNL